MWEFITAFCWRRCAAGQISIAGGEHSESQRAASGEPAGRGRDPRDFSADGTLPCRFAGRDRQPRVRGCCEEPPHSGSVHVNASADIAEDKVAYFLAKVEAGQEVLHPQESARSGWGTDQIRGPAVSAVLARAVEGAFLGLGRTGLRPVRWSIDMFRPARMCPSAVRVSVIRDGRRLCLLAAELFQDSAPVAKASALFLAHSEHQPATAWTPTHRIASPEPSQRPATVEPRLFYSDDLGWTGDATGHQNASRKQTWHFPAPIVDGELPSAFQFVATAADVTNIVTNWGRDGLNFINADVTLALARLPSGMEVGLSAADRFEHEGIAVGVARVFDRGGAIGTALVSALANQRSPSSPRLGSGRALG